MFNSTLVLSSTHIDQAIKQFKLQKNESSETLTGTVFHKIVKNEK